MITTYEKHSTAFNVLQYGFDPIYEAYRIKDYKMRRVGEISTPSLRRLENLLKHCHISWARTTPNWFSEEHIISKEHNHA